MCDMDYGNKSAANIGSVTLDNFKRNVFIQNLKTDRGFTDISDHQMFRGRLVLQSQEESQYQ